ncbi:MAG: hypothetical protein ACOYM1_10630 [Methylovulum sp.]|jgi:hypothetical protein
MHKSKFLHALARWFAPSNPAHNPTPAPLNSINEKKQPKPFTVGLFYPEKAIFLIRNPAAEHSHRLFEFAYPAEQWLPLTGDWANSGKMGSGLYDPNTSLFYLRDQDDSGYPDNTVYFGPAKAGWLPIAGDWNGAGRDNVGLYDPSTAQFFLNHTGKGGQADRQFSFGAAAQAYLPLAGDWDGDGIDGIGLYDPINSLFYLRNQLSSGAADYIFQFGTAGEDYLPLVGDWDGDGYDSIGLYHLPTQQFALRNALSAGAADSQFTFGLREASVKPIALHWNDWQLRDIQSDHNLAERLGVVKNHEIEEVVPNALSVGSFADEAQRSTKPVRMGLRRVASVAKTPKPPKSKKATSQS